jgi:hypothetical protein
MSSADGDGASEEVTAIVCDAWSTSC